MKACFSVSSLSLKNRGLENEELEFESKKKAL